MQFSWVIIAWTDAGLEGRLLQSDYFTVAKNPGFLKPLGLTSERAYRPWLVRPHIEVWQEVLRKVNRETEGRAFNRTSKMALRDPGSTVERHYNFNIRLYRPGTVCIEVVLDEPEELDIEFLFERRNFSTHITAATVVDCLIGMLIVGDIKAYSLANSYSAKAAMLYPAPVNDAGFASWRDEHKDEIVGLFLNNKNYKYSDPSLPDKIINKNREINVKFAKSAFSMISKQGVLTSYPDQGSDLKLDLKREHMRRFRFLEYALSMQSFLERYKEIRNLNKEKADFLLYLCMPYLSEKANIPRTVTGSNTWKILAEEFGLEKSLVSLEGVIIDQINDKEPYYMNISPEKYDELNYEDFVNVATRPSRNYLRKDFLGGRVIPTIVGIIISLIAMLGGIYKIFFMNNP